MEPFRSMPQDRIGTLSYDSSTLTVTGVAENIGSYSVSGDLHMAFSRVFKIKQRTAERRNASRRSSNESTLEKSLLTRQELKLLMTSMKLGPAPIENHSFAVS